MQHLEIHWDPQGIKGNHNPAIRDWPAAFHAASSDVGYPVGLSSSQTTSSIKDAGFINVFERIIPCYFSYRSSGGLYAPQLRTVHRTTLVA